MQLIFEIFQITTSASYCQAGSHILLEILPVLNIVSLSYFNREIGLFVTKAGVTCL